MKAVCVILCLVGAVLAAIGGFMAFDQHSKITTFTPVGATVVSSRVEMKRGSKRSRTYTPIVEYSYEIGSARYTSRRVLPISVSSGQSWAAAVVARYPAGTRTEAYYNPRAPGESFLIRRHSIVPHVFLTIGLMLLGAGLSLPSWRGPPAAEPEPAGRGWYRLSTRRTVRAREWVWRIGGVMWEAFVAIGIGSYFLLAERPLGVSDIVIGSIAAGLGAIPLLVAAYYMVMGGSFADATVVMDRMHLVIGQGAKVRVEQSVYRSMRVEEIAVGLVCRRTTRTQAGGKTTYSTDTTHERWWPVLEDRQTLGGEAIGGAAGIEVPHRGKPTTIDAEKKKEYPRYEWHIGVRTKVGGRPDYRGTFAVVVEAGGGGQGSGHGQ